MELLPDVLVYRRLHRTNLSRTPVANNELLQVVSRQFSPGREVREHRCLKILGA